MKLWQPRGAITTPAHSTRHYGGGRKVASRATWIFIVARHCHPHVLNWRNLPTSEKESYFQASPSVQGATVYCKGTQLYTQAPSGAKMQLVPVNCSALQYASMVDRGAVLVGSVFPMQQVLVAMSRIRKQLEQRTM